LPIHIALKLNQIGVRYNQVTLWPAIAFQILGYLIRRR